MKNLVKYTGAVLIGLFLGIASNNKIEANDSDITVNITIGDKPRVINTTEAKILIESFADIAHTYYKYKDYEEYDFLTNTYKRKYTFWDDVISEEESYNNINQILNSDWGNFFD